ncbi:uncharacterized protein LOC101746464 isoform X2 [Bombyx mori]|uniref:Chorein N-terminal domain-containing protein n=1 Tax=Bombyx mori TaxID=7091 RepID=A0A8R2LX63_BOMMO|nr:uncharacterized protein LOC101746464 isoform X2 [Bombyx mori]
MFKIESYVTPILLSYVDKYVRDFKPADAQVSLWGGGVALHNLVLKADVLQQELALPFTLVSGRIHELLIQVPWTKIMSEPIIVTIDTIECVLSLNPPAPNEETVPPDSPRRAQVVEAPPGYMQALVRRIVSNISLRIHHLIVKYVQDDIVMSLNVKHLAVDSADSDWEPSFADIDQNLPIIRRLVHLDDLTLCLDRADSDGKIRFYQEPLLYRCQLELRVLTRLVSANTRRASSLSVQLRSSKLAWGVTSDQLTLLLRLIRERSVVKVQPQTTKIININQPPAHLTSSSSSEPARTESWSEWAWSWFPMTSDAEGGIEEERMPPAPTPLHFNAYFDDISLVFKVMESESSTRKRSRGVLELCASHGAIKSYVCRPTSFRMQMATRTLTIKSSGRCVCGHLDYTMGKDEPTVYLCKSESERVDNWTWPANEFSGGHVETAEAAQETPKDENQNPEPIIDESDQSGHSTPEPKNNIDEDDKLWAQMSPLLYVNYTHERSPPDVYENPYEHPPEDFQYSDWAEESNLKIEIESLDIKLSTGLLHRLSALKNIYKELPPVPDVELPMRVLTVEECDALFDNLPLRRLSVEMKGLNVRVHPFDHSAQDRTPSHPVVLEVYMPRGILIVSGPLYPHRVCSAACQMPDDAGPLWQGARVHVSAILSGIEASICSVDGQTRPCARTDLRIVAHSLQYREFFTKRESVVFSYSIKMREVNICGSAARLQTAWLIPMSLINEKISLPLRHTTLPKDALNDEESVALDVTLEDLCVRGYITKHINTHILTLQCARATAMHEPKDINPVKQAWLFSGPDTPTTTPYLRVAVQWCSQPMPNSMDYIGVWMEQTAISVDPLFVAWLAYRPRPRLFDTPSHSNLSKSSSTQFYWKRRATPPSSSGRGVSRSGSGAELVHVRPRSIGSSSEPSEKKEKQPPSPTRPPVDWLNGERLLAIHDRLRGMLVNVEVGLMLIYVTTSTVSATDCFTVRDAMERHASMAQPVLAISAGRFLIYSSLNTKQLWHEIRHDGPTFVTPRTEQKDLNSFPWKLRLSDVSCYTLEVKASSSNKDKAHRSQLKSLVYATPRTVLEMVTTTITLSVVTKSLQQKAAASTSTKKDHKKHPEASAEEETVKYFMTGMDFKPSTLKEFVRGPTRRKKTNQEQAEQSPERTAPPNLTSGPVVSLGVHLHADTPPIIIRLDHDQVHTISATLHNFKHILNLMRRSSDAGPRQSFTPPDGSHKSLIRSMSEIEEGRSPSDETTSENRSDLISIFESHSAQDLTSKLKTFFWFQWVVSRATLVIAANHAKLAFDIDDIISTIDMQSHYNQLRIKLASASVRQYERVGSDEWTAGVLGGRVLEAREPSNAKEDNHFLSITVTQAQISNLPSSWREELHPKLLENKTSTDTMWELYATLAPLEVVLQPTVVDHIIALVHEMASRSFCPQQVQPEASAPTVWQWPFCYITAGGLRLLLTCDEEDTGLDDTFMFVIGKISVNPHPENPICRRAINSTSDSGWANNSEYEGRQYEVIIKNVAIRSAQFRQIVNQEVSEAEILKGTGGENPALKWSQPTVAPVVTPILHALDIGCVLAPALYNSGTLVCGPAVEVNLVSDCAIELSVDQLDLLRRVIEDIRDSIQESNELSLQLNEMKDHVCPYATVLESEPQDLNATSSDTSFNEDIMKYQEFAKAAAADSGVETTSHSTFKSGRLVEEPTVIPKKSISVGFAEQITDASDFLEVYVTMGIIELSLYTKDNSSPEVVALRPPVVERVVEPVPLLEVIIHNSQESSKRDEDESPVASKSNPESVPNIDVGTPKPEHNETLPLARKSEGNLPLIHLTLQQPNLYYWRKKTQRSLQVSLFDLWLGLGVGKNDSHWSLVLLSTAKGAVDPVTDIPPALATMKILVPSSGYVNSSSSSNAKGSIRIDVERPIRLDLCTDRFKRVKGIINLINKQVPYSPSRHNEITAETPHLYGLRRFFSIHGIESVTMLTSQLVACGSEGVVGCNASTVQIAIGSRPERLATRASVTGLVIAAGPPERRHPMLQPLMMGIELDAQWEAWRRAEGGMSARDPTVRVGIEVDCVTVDLKPEDLAALKRIKKTLLDMSRNEQVATTLESNANNDINNVDNTEGQPTPLNVERPPSLSSIDTTYSTETGDHYYKDDLRTGAFKIVSGGQLPMAYQVILHGSCVSWRYPHPRAITRLIVFPLPGLVNDIPCVLEFYIPMLGKWEAHTHFSLPVGEPNELRLQVTPPETVFAQIWRFRIYEETGKETPYEFKLSKFTPRNDPLQTDTFSEPPDPTGSASGVTAEQLSGVIRVDSYFAPRLLPNTRLFVRAANIEVHFHNSLPYLTSNATVLEGYYVSRPLMRSHRVLTLYARNLTAHAELDSPAGISVLIDTRLSFDILECDTGTMDGLVSEFPAQLALSVPMSTPQLAKVRARLDLLRVRLHVPRLRVIHALVKDWRVAIDQYLEKARLEPNVELETKNIRTKRDFADAMEEALEGRVSLWVHNSSSAALRMGQEGTDEVVPLGPGTRLAYRWRNPTAPKTLRFSLAGPTADWHWSNSIPFTLGSHRVRLEDAERLGGKGPGAGVFVHAAVEGKGARLCLHLSGRLVLANMLRFDLLYKVRARCSDSNQLCTICSGELMSEDVGTSVLCGDDSEMMLKIKFMSHDTGWSGDIPLKECPKENVPWLVKVPSQGNVPYMAVWCRVVKARSDGRILATVWPLYVLKSHLPLDTDVLIRTESGISVSEACPEPTSAPLVQSAPGRGTSVHLLAPGTTSARHNLLFQYRNIECPVTRDAVPLHYGVPDTSVFEKRGPVSNVDHVIDEIIKWLDDSGRKARSDWPYSIVSKQWCGLWQPALLQPRSDVTVRYQAVRAGGGCCLELQLSPVVLLCNAAPIALTLRAYDAAPLCKLEPGTVIAPPSTVVKKPFFMSVEMGRETFVSGQLQVSNEDPGRYGAPPPGQVALDHSLEFAIQCNQKVALMTMYYQLIKEINVLGVNSTYELLNRLDTKVMVSAIAVPKEVENDVALMPKTFKLADPTKSVHGLQLCRFWLQGRWRGGDPSELRLYLCLALPSGHYPAHTPVPVRLGAAPLRRSVALIDANRESVPIVITQIKHEDRWMISVARDRCPQFVVHNRTRHTLAVAQPMMSPEEPSTSAVPVMSECSGAGWWCIAHPQAVTHYTTPSHNNRYPPPANTFDSKPEIPFLTFTIVHDDGNKEWCQPAAMTDGEQLVQLPDNVTIKLRVHAHPHSTHIELQNVDQDDISASDIRRRLFGAFATHISHESLIDTGELSVPQSLDRLGGHVKLLHQNVAHEESGESSPIPWANEHAICGPQGRNPIAVAAVTVEHCQESPDAAELSSAVENPSHLEEKIHFEISSSEVSIKITPEKNDAEWDENGRMWPQNEQLRCVIAGVIVELASAMDTLPLIALHADRVAVLIVADAKRTKTAISISNVQIDNQQYETGQYDFAVVACTRADPSPSPDERPPPLWTMFSADDAFATKHENARVLIKIQHDNWTVLTHTFKELTELDFHVGPLALYIEDAYVTALVELSRLAQSSPDAVTEAASLLAEERSLQVPLRLRLLHIRPLDLTLTLHTAVRMYIALDQSPLRLSAFELRDMMTSTERLTHALTVHYLSAAILGAGWVVGGLELLGAPGALAARVGSATGGVRGVASAAVAALLKSLSAWAGSLARNLDLLAGDEEHARRAAAARRRPPPSFVAGLVAGITNFAINILGAVGGLAHHPLVGVAVGETESGATALRRGLLGALTKPLSATADLVAYAGHGLLRQTGWDPVPQPRPTLRSNETVSRNGWRRDCVRWSFRLAELTALSGFEALLDNAPLQLLLTHKFLVVADPQTERIVEMIDFRFCTLEPYQGPVIRLIVTQRRQSKLLESRAVDEDDEFQISAAAMARVARYTGTEGAPTSESRVLSLVPTAGRAYALHVTLATLLHHNVDSHFQLL